MGPESRKALYRRRVAQDERPPYLNRSGFKTAHDIQVLIHMASNNVEELSAFFPIDAVGLCPPETIIVPVVGILLVLALGKFILKFIKQEF
jgi:hypothetical protein